MRFLDSLRSLGRTRGAPHARNDAARPRSPMLREVCGSAFGCQDRSPQPMRPRMRAPLFLLVAITTALPAQRTAARVGRPIVYEISFPNAVHHEAEISVTFPNVPRRPLEVRMSRSSPGRYALHEFAKNVYSVKAVDSRGRPLDVRRPNPHQWDVHGHDGTVRITYTLFADRTYAGIDLTHAHLNMPATFMWARGLDERPIRITFRAPDTRWRIATQLAPTADSATFTAPGLQYFLDSPTEISAHELFPWQV